MQRGHLHREPYGARVDLRSAVEESWEQEEPGSSSPALMERVAKKRKEKVLRSNPQVTLAVRLHEHDRFQTAIVAQKSRSTYL